MVVPRRQESRLTPKTTERQTISAVRTRINLVIFSNFRSVNPLSKVLFIVPSRYFYTIGLPPIFSFGRKLPPILHSTQKERDSSNSILLRKKIGESTGLSPSMALCSKRLIFNLPLDTCLKTTTWKRKSPVVTVNYSRFIRHYWGNPLKFLFLHLIICLNSVGNLLSIQVQVQMCIVSTFHKENGNRSIRENVE